MAEVKDAPASAPQRVLGAQQRKNGNGQSKPAESAPKELFRKFAQNSSIAVGSPWAFMGAVLLIIVWAATGPIFHFSDTWQLVINTGTTIVTFLMVFLIQNTQNRDARAIHLKLDELIRGLKGARNWLVDLENCSDEELAEIEQEMKRIRSQARSHGRDAPDVARAHEHVKTVADSPTRRGSTV
jgi:low affinity Fe/Cu permease